MSEDPPEWESMQRRAVPENGEDVPSNRLKAHSGCGWLVFSPVLGIALLVPCVNAGYELSTKHHIRYDQHEIFGFVASGVATCLISLFGIYVSNLGRGVNHCCIKALLWAFACGILGGGASGFAYCLLLYLAFGHN
jgi:hypothetical protein